MLNNLILISHWYDAWLIDLLAQCFIAAVQFNVYYLTPRTYWHIYRFCQSERPSRRLRGPNLQTHPFTIPVYSQNPSTRPLILKLLRISITHFSQLLNQLSCPYFSDSPGLKKPAVRTAACWNGKEKLTVCVLFWQALGRIQSYRPTFRIESVTHNFRMPPSYLASY